MIKPRKEFINHFGKRGFHIGRIMPNKKHFGIRIWTENWGIEKTIYIKYL